MNKKTDSRNFTLENISKFKWDKIGEWNELWYFTELCFLGLYSNPLTKSFLVQNMNSISLNSEWFYEVEKNNKWNIDQRNVTRQDLKFYQELILNIKEIIQKVENLVVEFENETMINKKVFKLFEKIFVMLWCVFLADIGKHLDEPIDDLLNNKHLSKKQAEEIKNYYLAANKPLAYQEEQENLDNIYNTLNKTLNVQELELAYVPENVVLLLVAHRNKFGWIGTSDIDTEPPSVADYLKRLKEFGAGKKFSKKTPVLKESTKKLICNSTVSLLESFKELSYLDNLTADLFGKINFQFQNLLSKQYKISFQDISWYTWSELKKLVGDNKKISDDDLSIRRLFRVMVQINGQIKTFYGKQNFEMIKSFLTIRTQRSVTSFRGIKASIGCVRGIARILKGVKDMDSIRIGDIIIANTTRPDLMPALRRCSAIVTDSGGVTSHAAIVSRELKIPCIVGTKIATNVLKDGDLIQVDADNGIVTILNK